MRRSTQAHCGEENNPGPSLPHRAGSLPQTRQGSDGTTSPAGGGDLFQGSCRYPVSQGCAPYRACPLSNPSSGDVEKTDPLAACRPEIRTGHAPVRWCSRLPWSELYTSYAGRSIVSSCAGPSGSKHISGAKNTRNRLCCASRGEKEENDLDLPVDLKITALKLDLEAFFRDLCRSRQTCIGASGMRVPAEAVYPNIYHRDGMMCTTPDTQKSRGDDQKPARPDHSPRE